ncbi:hypothetical protein [Streptomyces sp. NPDC058954]|uniref:hypothetical protein n=1 Tax=Streptomyces sp. NPDC058954 TaxID=3346677 RepID=UPI0036CEDA1C
MDKTCGERVTQLEHHFLTGAIDAYRLDMDTTATPRVLVIGLDPYRLPGPWDPEPVAKAIEAGLAKFAEHDVSVETCLIGLDGNDDVEVVVGNALRAHTWECVTVGGGLRHSDDQVELLEQVINLVRRHAPEAAIAFNTTPATTYEAAARWIE